MPNRTDSQSNQIPQFIPGYGPTSMWKEVDRYEPTELHLPKRAQKHPQKVATIQEAVERSQLKDGMRISFHHHLRMGDLVVAQVLEVVTAMGIKDLTLCVSSVMGPACQAVLDAIKAKTVSAIETTGLKEPLSSAISDEILDTPVIFRSHGGRARAIEMGQTPIDVAFIAASAVDEQGSLYGTVGKNFFGSMGYAQVDALHAQTVVAITDTFIEKTDQVFGSISGEFVDWIVAVPAIGDASLMSGGSLSLSKSPTNQLIASLAMQTLIASGAIKGGFNYQSGSGGVSLLVSTMLGSYLKERGIVGGFASGGITAALVEMAQQKLFERLWDVQSFDAESARSLAINAFHHEMDASLYANPYHPNCIAHQLDVMILSATEVDLSFNINSISGTNGRIIGALGGAPDTAWGSRLVVVVMPSFRNRIPTIHPHVNLICTPGCDVDVVVTERGVAVNPRREDLTRQLQDGGIPLSSIENLMNHTFQITGRPSYPQRKGPIRAIVESRDGAVLDLLRGK